MRLDNQAVRSESDLAAGDKPGRGTALLFRKKTGKLEYLFGEATEVSHLRDIPVPIGEKSAVLALIPFRQVRERGFACHDDHAPIQVISAKDKVVIDTIPFEGLEGQVRLTVSEAQFDLDDAAFRRLVRDVIDKEIRRGAGSNFVVHRCLNMRTNTAYHGWRPKFAQLAMRNLLASETSAYWRFAVQLPSWTFIGASPECHLEYGSGLLRMSPMSGTLPITERTGRQSVLDFLADRKETEELFMVVDEELKMLCRLNPGSIHIDGPRLDVYGQVAHTSFELVAETTADFREVLLNSLFAPTVTGSPLREAFNVIRRREQRPRHFYSGVICLITRESRKLALDSAILIRTATVNRDGFVSIPVGATIVRHSVPAREARETTAKAAELRRAIDGVCVGTPVAAMEDVLIDPEVRGRLQKRRAQMSEVWMSRDAYDASFCGRRALLVDFDDDWTMMLAFMLSRMGIQTLVKSWKELPRAETALVQFYRTMDEDLLILGAGPGNPSNRHDLRLDLAFKLATVVGRSGPPTLAVCLSHECMCLRFGLKVARLAEPYQGTARSIKIDGIEYVVGFYNSFAAIVASGEAYDCSLWRDERSGEVYGLTAPGIISVQFHLESILSKDGRRLAKELLGRLLLGE